MEVNFKIDYIRVRLLGNPHDFFNKDGVPHTIRSGEYYARLPDTDGTWFAVKSIKDGIYLEKTGSECRDSDLCYRRILEADYPTRVDYCFDFADFEEYPNFFETYHIMRACGGNHKLIGSERDGFTITIGSRQSDYYLRVYEKHKESDLPYPVIRFELECKSKTVHYPGSALAKIIEMVKPYNFLLLFQIPNGQIKFEIDKRTEHRSDAELEFYQRYEWFMKQCSRTFVYLCEKFDPKELLAKCQDLRSNSTSTPNDTTDALMTFASNHADILSPSV